jgi:hypothetical protein
MMSSRHLLGICALLAVALVPTVIHSYTGDVVADRFSTTAIPASLAGFTSTPSDRGANWGKRRFDSDDWLERNYANRGDDVRLTVIRSYDSKSLYHHPELAVAYGPKYGSSFGKQEVVRLKRRSSIPIHVLRPTVESSALGLYVLHYDGEYVEDPLWFQFRIAGKLLFSRRQPMTLFFVHDLRVPGTPDLEKLPSVALLFEAIDQFLGQQGS